MHVTFTERGASIPFFFWRSDSPIFRNPLPPVPAIHAHHTSGGARHRSWRAVTAERVSCSATLEKVLNIVYLSSFCLLACPPPGRAGTLTSPTPCSCLLFFPWAGSGSSRCQPTGPSRTGVAVTDISCPSHRAASDVTGVWTYATVKCFWALGSRAGEQHSVDMDNRLLLFPAE